MNGTVEHGEHPTTTTTHIGKRKRTSSPEPQDRSVTHPRSTLAQSRLEKILESIRKHDTTGRILKHDLPPRSDEPTLKRQRTDPSVAPTNTIESRIENGIYGSINELLADVAYLKDEFDQDTQANGAIAQVDAISDLLSTLNDALPYATHMQVNGVHMVEDDIEHAAAQVLSLRSQTETGIKQLFSGLPQSANGSVTEINGRKLPNGFELTDITMMDRSKRSSKESRTFGEVFKPHRTVKVLEGPRAAPRYRDVSALDFIPPYSNNPSTSRSEYKSERPDSGAWLEYSADGSQAPLGGKKVKPRKDTPISLFRAAFSSFAPSTDHSKSVVTDADHSRRWWRKYTNMHTILDLPEVDESDKQPEEAIEFNPSDLDDMLDNYISEADLDNLDESEKLLNEVSELLQTLSSYQNIRDSAVAKGPTSASKPTKPEIDVYEMLKSQLQILVSELPPYAVSKLNGDQLDALNISTNLLVTPPEFSGTSHADEHTLRRAKAAQIATAAVARPAPVTATRNNYATPASAYNTQAYNRNVPATAYAARQAAVTYSTPRAAPPQAAPYTQPTYRAASGVYPTSTIQQYQRAQAVANGLAQPSTSAQQFMQRPPQAAAQHVHSNAHNVGNDSSSVAVTNGQSSQVQQPRQHEHSRPGMPTSTSQAELDQRMTDSMKLLRQQSAQTRQASGTPQPPNGTVVVQHQTTAAGTTS